jgi:hypothetical protein
MHNTSEVHNWNAPTKLTSILHVLHCLYRPSHKILKKHIYEIAEKSPQQQSQKTAQSSDETQLLKHCEFDQFKTGVFYFG